MNEAENALSYPKKLADAVDLELSKEEAQDDIIVQAVVLDARATRVLKKCLDISTEPSLVRQTDVNTQIQECKQELFDIYTSIRQLTPEIKTMKQANAFQRAILLYQHATTALFQKQLEAASGQRDSLRRILQCLDIELPTDADIDPQQAMYAVCDFDLQRLRMDLASAKEKQLYTCRCLQLSEDLLDATLATLEAQIAQGDLTAYILQQIESAKEQIKLADENFVQRAKIEKCKVIGCKTGLILIIVAAIVIICAVIGVRIAN